MAKFLKYVLLLFAVGFFAHSLWLYWFAYSTGSPFGEVVGPYFRARYHLMWGTGCLLFVVLLKQHEELKKARRVKDSPE